MATELSFADPADRLDLDERRAPRVSVRLAAVLKCERAPTQQVEAADFTRFGCQIATEKRVSVGTFVTLDVPTFVDVFGWVSWSHDQALGIDFSHSLPPAVLAHIVSLGPLRGG